MNINIAEEIKEILFENGKVVLPGLGAFNGDYKATTIDYAQGRLSPPSLQIQFSDVDQVNDGVLIQHICDKYHITAADAQKEVEAYIDQSIRSLSTKELVMIPEVGRLYRNYNDKIQFLPDATNFNTDNYALPSVQFYPVSRLKSQLDNGATNSPTVQAPLLSIQKDAEPLRPLQPPLIPIQSPTIPHFQPAKKLNFFSRPVLESIMPGAVIIALLGLSAYIYFSGSSNTEAPLGDKARPAGRIHLNVKPPVEPPPPPATTELIPAQSTTTPTPQQAPLEQLIEKKEAGKQTLMEANPPVVNPEAGWREAQVLIGGFKNKSNIRKLIVKIQEAGFSPYSREQNDVTLVGCTFPYEDRNDLNDKLNQIRRKFKSEIRLIKK